MRTAAIRFICMAMWCCLPALLLAQTAFFHGTVTDAAGLPLFGATVSIEELSIGGATNSEGEYTFTIPENLVSGQAATLIARFVGFRTRSLPITLTAGSHEQNFQLNLDLLDLDEVVVTGIASERSKATSEVAVSRVDASQLLETNSYQDISQLLAGKANGVAVQPATGNVAGGVRFVMRSSTGLNGNGQPVIYVDGVRVDNAEIVGQADLFQLGGQGSSMLATLNSEDIDTIEILKGPASAALYGTSGSNGVVLITTKRGRLAVGDESSLNIRYKATIGANSQLREYTASNAAHPDQANGFFRNGAIADHSFSVSGGSRSIRYFTSFENREEKAHFRNSSQDRQSFRANVEIYPRDNFDLQFQTNYVLSEIARPQNDNNLFGYLGNTLLQPAPFAITDSISIDNATNIQRVSRFVGSAQAEYRPLDALTLRASVGIDASDLRNDASFPSNLQYLFIVNGARAVSQRRNKQQTFDLNARYAFDLTKRIKSNSILGTQLFNQRLSTFAVGKQNFSTELITNLGAGADLLGGDEGFLHVREAGVYEQQEFSLDQTYFLTLGLRRDYASTVGQGAPSIWYPKVSGAVLLTERDFLPSGITFLKIRAAYGETGQLPNPLDKAFLRWVAESSAYGSGAVTSFIGNEDIEPERVQEIELGVEAEYQNNMGLELTWYRQHAKNSIIDFLNAPSTGLTASAVPFNIGTSTGWGLEVGFTAASVQRRNLGVDFTLLWNYQKNEVKDLGGAQPVFDFWNANAVAVGVPRDGFYTWSSHASFDTDGTYLGPELTQTDADGDGEPDRAFFGTPYPEHNGSLRINVDVYRHLTVSAMADWVLGFSVRNGTQYFMSQFGTLRRRSIAMVNVGLATAEDVGLGDDNIQTFEVGTDEYRAAAETVAGTEAFVGGVSADGNWIEDGDYIKLREISVRYDFTHLLRRWTPDRRIRSIAFTLAGRNLWQSSKYHGPDPEVNVSGARNATRAMDFLTLPQPRVIYGTLTIDF